MIYYRNVRIDKAEPFKVVCNKCGKTYKVNSDETHPDFTEIRNTYGYGSQKDGDKYCSDICEPCMDEIYATFAIPPQIVGMTVIGEDSGTLKIFVDDVGEPMLPARRIHD